MNELIIDKSDLLHNIDVINSKVESDYTIIAVVKGNAYGLGMKEMVNILKQKNIEYFAVATYKEALEFRKEFLDKLLLLTPYSDEEIISDLIDKDVIFTIESIKQAKIIDKYAKEKNVKVYAHIKVDTGLNRYGFKYNDINSIINTINNTENIKYFGIYSHFSSALSYSEAYTKLQYNRFIKVIEDLKEKDIEFRLKHICNSSAYFKYPEMRLNSSRIGSAFLGLAIGLKNDLKKIGIYKSKIVKIMDVKKGEYIGYARSYKAKKDMTLAIIDSGYFDGVGKTLIDQRFSFKSRLKGFLLSFKNLFKEEDFLINNLKVVGQIGMHETTIDITGKDYNVNDEIYFYVRPVFVDSSIKRVYKANNKIDIK